MQDELMTPWIRGRGRFRWVVASAMAAMVSGCGAQDEAPPSSTGPGNEPVPPSPGNEPVLHNPFSDQGDFVGAGLRVKSARYVMDLAVGQSTQKSGSIDFCELPGERWSHRSKWESKMKTRSIFRSTLASLTVVTGVALAHAALASVPGTLTHQGRLFQTASGHESRPVNGALKITFRLYDTVEGGDPLWHEDHEVTFEDGYYAVHLGDTTPLDSAVDGSADRYLGITIGDDQEMSPRAPLGSVPYALVARDATGDLHAKSLSVGGKQVITPDGQWVGLPMGLSGTVGPTGAVGPTGPQGPQGAQESPARKAPRESPGPRVRPAPRARRRRGPRRTDGPVGHQPVSVDHRSLEDAGRQHR